MKTQKTYLYALLLLLTAISSCQKKTATIPTKMIVNNNFEWEGNLNSPLGYPMDVYQGGFEWKSGSVSLYLGTTNGVWGGSGGGMSSGVKPLPTHLNLIWLSYAENKFYKINCAIDHDKMIPYFEKGFDMLASSGSGKVRHENYTNIIAGLAPGGVVVVWIWGSGKQIEIGRYQGEPTEISQEEINTLDNHEKLLFEQAYRDETMENDAFNPPELREARKGKPIPFGLWDTYRKKYTWRPTFIIQRDGRMNEDIAFDMFNGEKETLINEEFIKNAYSERAIPTSIGFGWYDKDGQGYGGYIEFNEKEVFDAFETVFKDNKDGKAEFELRANMVNTYLAVRLKGNGKEVALLKCNIEVYKSSKLTKHYKKQ